jgi:hypothetical protein
MLTGITEHRFGTVKIFYFVRYTESMELQRILTARPLVLGGTWFGSVGTRDRANQTKDSVIALHYANVVRFILCLKRKIRYIFKKMLSAYFDNRVGIRHTVLVHLLFFPFSLISKVSSKSCLLLI